MKDPDPPEDSWGQVVKEVGVGRCVCGLDDMNDMIIGVTIFHTYKIKGKVFV